MKEIFKTPSVFIKLNLESGSGMVVRLTFTEKILILIQMLSVISCARNTEIFFSVVPKPSVYFSVFVSFQLCS